MKWKWIIYLITGCSWLFIIWNLPVGFKSLADEGFFILGLNPEQNLGIQHSQFFQMARFIFRVLSIEPSILYSRIIAWLILTGTLLFFSYASYQWLRKKENVTHFFGIYLSLVFLQGAFFFLSGYELSLSFNHLHVFFITVLFSLYLLWDVTERTFVQSLLIFFMGGLSFLSILNYFPAAILVLATILFLILLKEACKWQNSLRSLLLFLMGTGFFAFIYNFSIYPVTDAVKEILYNVKNPAFGTGGYTIRAYVRQAIDFGRSFTPMFLCSCGLYFLYWISLKQRQWNKKGVLFILFILFLLFLVLEQSLLKYNAMLAPVIWVCLAWYLSNHFPEIQWKNRQQIVSHIQKCIFFLFPLIAVQGTNVSIHYKVLYFAFIWILPFTVYLFRIRETKSYKLLIYLTVGLALYLNICYHFLRFDTRRGTFLNSKYEVEDKRLFNHIRLKQSQIDYFQQVDSLLQTCRFNPKQDKILVLDCDYAALLYLNATNYGGLMHEINHLPAYSSIYALPENAPDYIIVLQAEKEKLVKIAGKGFKWDFPEGYTEYNIGRPDFGIPYPVSYWAGPRSLFVKNEKIRNQ